MRNLFAVVKKLEERVTEELAFLSEQIQVPLFNMITSLFTNAKSCDKETFKVIEPLLEVVRDSYYLVPDSKEKFFQYFSSLNDIKGYQSEI